MVKSPQGYDTGKIAIINDIMNSFFKGEVDLDRCLVLLHDVATAPPTCGTWATLFFFTVSSFCASATLFNGTWIDASISGAVGLLVSILYILSAHFPIYARIFEMSTSILVAIICRSLYRYCCFTSVAMSSILILLPGYTMTVGVVILLFPRMKSDSANAILKDRAICKASNNRHCSACLFNILCISISVWSTDG